MHKDITGKIKSRRKELQLSDVQVAEMSGLSIDDYFIVELHADEIYTAVDLEYVRKLCTALRYDLSELFEMQCSFCEGSAQYSSDYMLPRNELIHKRRIEMGISTEELGDRVGFTEAAILDSEINPDHLETWPIDFINDFASAIDVPLQVLLGIKCKKCNR